MARADTTLDLFGNLDTFTGGEGGFGGALDDLLGQVTTQAEAPRPLDWFQRGGDAGAGPAGGGPLDRLLSGIRAGANALPDVPIWDRAFGDYSASGKKTKAAQQRDGELPVPGAAPSAAPSGAAGAPGAGWGAPSAQQLDAELAGSPLAGQGATIASIAAKHGVPVTVAMGILRQESSYGRNASGYNYGGLMNADGSHTLAQFGTVEQGLEAVIGNMGSALYRGKTISQFMNTYAPPSENDTTSYINNILTLDHKWGGHSDWNTVVTGNAPAGPPAGAAPNAAGYAFPVTGYSGKVDLYHGTSANAADIFAPEGTAIGALANGTVQDASWNDLGGWTVTMRLDNGLLVYMAHMRDRPMVQAGQRVSAGTQLGVVGQTGNAQGTGTHLHIGIGRDIQSGAGPEGGAGTPWGTGPQENAVGLLTWILGGGR